MVGGVELNIGGGTEIEFDPSVAVGLLPTFAGEALPSNGAPTAISHLCPGSPCAGFSFAEPSVGVICTGIVLGDTSTGSTGALVGSEEQAVIKKTLQKARRSGVECMIVVVAGSLEFRISW